MKNPIDLLRAFCIGVREAYTDIVSDCGPWVYGAGDEWLQPAYDCGCLLGERIRVPGVRLGLIRYEL